MNAVQASAVKRREGPCGSLESRTGSTPGNPSATSMQSPVSPLNVLFRQFAPLRSSAVTFSTSGRYRYNSCLTRVTKSRLSEGLNALDRNESNVSV